jgi:hypothetical protein
MLAPFRSHRAYAVRSACGKGALRIIARATRRVCGDGQGLEIQMIDDYSRLLASIDQYFRGEIAGQEVVPDVQSTRPAT